MVQTNWLTPFAQIGPELRIELRMALRELHLPLLTRGPHRSDAPILPEQRIDDERIVAQRKAENLLQSVRHGAVRR